jgi:hypothetical protein
MVDPENLAALREAKKSMVLRNPELDKVTDLMRDWLGGSNEYYALHLRVGDGKFQMAARATVRASIEQFCVHLVGIPQEQVRSLLDASDASRGVPPLTDNDPILIGGEGEWRRGGPPEGSDVPPPRRVTTRAESPIHPSLDCRGTLHTDPLLVPLNAPLYLATDSRVPHSDLSLAPVFDLFPCTFVLSDFTSSNNHRHQPYAAKGGDGDVAEGLDRVLNGLRNSDDGVMLGPFLVPYIDAMVAAKGRAVVGTPHSTFSM